MNKIYLLPGNLVVASEPTLISTILGSCVAVALYDASAKIGGLNHYLLAQVPKDEKPNARYAEYALPKLLEEMLKLGAKKSLSKLRSMAVAQFSVEFLLAMVSEKM